jgi:hypothetical protein
MLKSTLISIGKYIANTIAGKIIAGATATAVIATGSAVTYNAAKPQSATVATTSISEEVSMENMSENNSSEITNSETMNSTDPTDNAVSRINAAADSAVSRVSEAADEAVSKIQSVVPASTEQKPTITVEKKKISWVEKMDGANTDCDITYVGAKLNEANKTIGIDYAGHFYYTEPDVVIKNANGDVLSGVKSFCKIAIPYNDISDISTLYFCCHDQKIKITVTE